MSEFKEYKKTCGNCANGVKKMTEEPCATCIDLGDSKKAPHFSKWEPKP